MSFYAVVLSLIGIVHAATLQDGIPVLAVSQNSTKYRPENSGGESAVMEEPANTLEPASTSTTNRLRRSVSVHAGGAITQQPRRLAWAPPVPNIVGWVPVDSLATARFWFAVAVLGQAIGPVVLLLQH